MKNLEEITGKIIGVAMKVHRTLGPGFLESVFQRALLIELGRIGLRAETERPIKVHYEEYIVGDFNADLFVEECVIVELKAIQALAVGHEVQTVHYLRATGVATGLLLNFGGPSLQFKRKYRPTTANLVNLKNPVNPVQNRRPDRATIIDISRPLHTGSPHWPSDTPTNFAFSARMADGAACNVGRLSLSVHNGSHADAPFHYNPRGPKIDALAPDLFVGPARVIDARGQTTFTEQLFAGLTEQDFAAAPRILLRTDTWTDLATFPQTWPLLEHTLPAWLGRRGVKLIGLDVPSVDDLHNKDMAIHHLMDAANILILESLDLRDVEAGVYELIALPLKIRGGDGSPVRAVLRR